jgi:LPXTG-motif cell wall-anchored protein
VKKKVRSGSRVTPKGTASGRYTPPIPREQKVSPPWVPVVMFALLGLGMLMIVANYLNLMPGEDPNNWYLLGGLGLITGGFVTATRLH